MYGFNHNRYVFFWLFALYGIYAAVKESQSMDQQYFKEKIDYRQLSKAFFTMLASSLAGLIWYQFGADVTFIVTAFASILIGLYFIFMTKKHNLNTYALITLLCHKPPPIP
jgi:uncharacterized membrane protein YjjP (DUF1212 family)